jgi:hypothetical protein
MRLMEDVIGQETADAEPQVDVLAETPVVERRVTQIMTKTIPEDMAVLEKNSEDEDIPALVKDSGDEEEPSAGMVFSLAQSSPLGPPALGTGSADQFEGKGCMDMWHSFLQHPRGS